MVEHTGMEAGRSPVEGKRLPRVTFRPRRTRYVALAGGAVWLAVSVTLALTTMNISWQGQTPVEPVDRIAMIGLGVVGALLFALLARPSVVADAGGVRVRNVLGVRWLPWDAVVAVRFDRDMPWASLELPDDERLSMLAIQVVDKEYALAAVRALRERHAASRAVDADR